ncbi:MAG: hypothetical protein GC185_07585 [Alphaproteobacteria bacterium]|nr:hypothetical protein [Alphaproteobacteria bacterium]
MTGFSLFALRKLVPAFAAAGIAFCAFCAAVTPAAAQSLVAAPPDPAAGSTPLTAPPPAPLRAAPEAETKQGVPPETKRDVPPGTMHGAMPEDAIAKALTDMTGDDDAAPAPAPAATGYFNAAPKADIDVAAKELAEQQRARQTPAATKFMPQTSLVVTSVESCLAKLPPEEAGEIRLHSRQPYTDCRRLLNAHAHARHHYAAVQQADALTPVTPRNFIRVVTPVSSATEDAGPGTADLPFNGGEWHATKK